MYAPEMPVYHGDHAHTTAPEIQPGLSTAFLHSANADNAMPAEHRGPVPAIQIQPNTPSVLSREDLGAAGTGTGTEGMPMHDERGGSQAVMAGGLGPAVLERQGSSASVSSMGSSDMGYRANEEDQAAQRERMLYSTRAR